MKILTFKKANGDVKFTETDTDLKMVRFKKPNGEEFEFTVYHVDIEQLVVFNIGVQKVCEFWVNMNGDLEFRGHNGYEREENESIRKQMADYAMKILL